MSRRFCVPPILAVAPSVPTAMPDSFVAGDTVQWTVPRGDVGDYPTSEGWTLTAHLLGPSTLRVLAAVVGADYQVTLDAAATKLLRAGTYRCVVHAQLGVERYTVGATAIVRVQPDPAAVRDGEAVSFAEQMLAAARTLYTQIVADPLAEYTYGDKQARRWSLAEARAELAQWQQAVWRERHPGHFAPRVATTFARPR